MFDQMSFASLLLSLTQQFYGCRKIPLRGHCDNITDLERDTAEHHSNVWALLKFRIEAGHTLLAELLSLGSKNATYTSSTVQNQVIDIICTQLQHSRVTKGKQAQWFTVIADEVTDLSNMELLILVLRYVDQGAGLARADLLCFLDCNTGITECCLADKITATLQGYGLDLMKLRGQVDMVGSVRGTAAIITDQYPLALYLHRASHSLNVAVVQVTSVCWV